MPRFTIYPQAREEIMRANLTSMDDSAWSKGDLAYDLGDTLETGIIKASKIGIRPGSNGYAAFITAFSRRVRSKQVSPRKAAIQHQEEAAQSAPPAGVIVTADFARSGA